MTLLATEIHNHDDCNRAFVVFAADRRITLPGGGYGGTRKKLLELPWLNAGIGYFGLAEVWENLTCKPMQGWLQDFIYRSADANTI